MFSLSLKLVFFVMVIEVLFQLSALSGGCNLLLRLSVSSVRNLSLLLDFLFGNTLFGCVLKLNYIVSTDHNAFSHSDSD